MLVLHVPYALQHTTTNRIAQILRCCLRVNVSEVHGPVRSPGDTEPLRCEGRVRAERPEAANIGVDGTERRRSRLCDKGLSRDGLGGLCGGLLRLGDVRATVFSIVDPLSGPCGLCWECVYNLEEKKRLMQVTERQYKRRNSTFVATEMLKK
jgi:hypothetical protein